MSATEARAPDERSAPARQRARPPTRAERRLVARLRKGDPRALDAIHAELGATVFGYLRQMLRDRGEAEDVFQQVMTEVWRRGAEYEPQRAGLSTWVLTIARSRAIDALRRRRLDPRDPAGLAASAPAQTPSGEDLLAERWRIAALLRLLSSDERTVLRLRFYDELTQTEIANRTGLPLGTVKTVMVRALHRLGEMIEADDARVARRVEAEGSA